MKRIAIALVLLVLASGISSSAPLIGMYADEDATYCFGETLTYSYTTVYYAVHLNELNAMTALEFKVNNCIDDPGCVIVSYFWNTPLVIGEPCTCIALAFSTPIPGPVAIIGYAEYFWLCPPEQYPGDDWVMCIYPCEGNDFPVVVDEVFIEHPAEGGRFTFNCTDPGGCFCLPGTGAETSSWGAIKSLY